MALRRYLRVFILLAFAPTLEGAKVKLNASMLTMHPDIAKYGNDIATAVDGDNGTDAHSPSGWIKCASSQTKPNSPHWLAIDLNGVFLISKVSVAFRYFSGTNAAVFVGNNPSATNGHDDNMCGGRWTQDVQRAPHFHDFRCRPPKWASHVSVQVENTKYIQVCEVKVYYSESSQDGVDVSFASSPTTAHTAFVGEPLLCTTSLVSSDALRLLKLYWSFPNGTVVSRDSRISTTQQTNSIGLSFTSLSAPKGYYSCHYTLNGKQIKRSFLVSAFDCGWSEWGSCSESCGKKGTTRGQYRNAVARRTESGCTPPTRDCYNTTCGELDLTAIGATVRQGPQNYDANSMQASLAIDGRLEMSTTDRNELDKSKCATSNTNSFVPSWLEIDLQEVYLISKVAVTFYGGSGRRTIIRVGSRTVNDVAKNSLCGQVDNYGDRGVSPKRRTVTCRGGLWGRYVTFQRKNTKANTITDNGRTEWNPTELRICEVDIYNKLDVGILYKQSNVSTVYINKGSSLDKDLLCGVSPDETGYNDALKLNWKRADGTYIPFEASSMSAISQKSSGQQELYVENVSVDVEGRYICEYTMPENNQTKTLTLQIFVNVDCSWSEWEDCSPSCGMAIGYRNRSANNPPQRHRGKECEGPSAKPCTNLPPCPPVIINFTTTREVDEGESLELTCKTVLSHSDRTVRFEWAKYGQDGTEISITDQEDRLTMDSHQHTKKPGSFYGTLHINSVSRLDKGLYKCRISVSTGTSSYSSNGVHVNVKYGPDNIVLHNLPKIAVKGQSAMFNCTADGNPTPMYAWLLNGTLVASKQTLSIDIVSYASAGQYTCVAKITIEDGINRTDNASAYMTVEGPPQNCSILRTKSRTSSSITLTVKCFDGYSLITGYLFRVREINSVEWDYRNITSANIKISAENLILRNLKANTQYDVQVRARNRHGYSSDDWVDNEIVSYNASTAKRDASQSPGGAIAGAFVVIILVVCLIVVGTIIRRRRQSIDKMNDVAMKESVGLAALKPDDHYAVPDKLDIQNSVAAHLYSTEQVSVIAYEDTTALLYAIEEDRQDRPTTVSWYKDGTQLPEEDPRFMTLRDGTLLIHNLQASDAGTYVCLAGHETATEELTVKLTVKTEQDALQQSNQWQNPNTPIGPTIQPSDRENFGRHAISTDKFADYVDVMHENNNVGFSDEFKRIYRNEIRLPVNAFKANKKVNRYKNIPTYDHSRVVLPTVSGFQSDYITSAYIDGYYRPKKYIAAQGPLKSTCTDFWRMIWAEDVPTIVMLTHLREGVKIKCHQYWPDSDANKSTFGPFVVTIRKIDVYADYIVRTFNVILEEKKRTVYQYHFTAWPDHDVPKFATALLGFIGRVNRDHARDRGPIVVHCSAGAGRTGTYIVIDTMMDRAEDSQPIDIYSCVTYLRTRRAQMVQTEAQYTFIHDAVLESVICGDTKIPVHDISRAIAKMSKKDPRSKMTGFQLHFKVLQASGPHPDSKSCKAGLRPQVQTKNRYKDVVPFDRSRVLLKTGEDSTDEYVNTTAGAEYINASFVDGYRRRGAFIVTQAPLKATVNDFWKMIWEQDCYSIVMLTPLEEEEKEMCHQYWPTSEKQQYGSITVEVNEETDSGDYVIRQMTVTESQATRVVTQFHYTNWLEYGSPNTPSDILDMINQLQKWQQATGDEVITIHCNDGVGRSGAFCGLFTLIETTNMESVIDFFHKVKAMRIQRPGMVQTVDQYMFMHEVILAYLDSFQTYSNFK